MTTKCVEEAAPPLPLDRSGRITASGVAVSEASHTVNTEPHYGQERRNKSCSERVPCACLLLSSGEAGTAEVSPLTPSVADSSEGEQAAGNLRKTPTVSAKKDVQLQSPGYISALHPPISLLCTFHPEHEVYTVMTAPVPTIAPLPAAQASIIAFRVRRYVSLSQHALQWTRGYDAVFNCGCFLFTEPTRLCSDRPLLRCVFKTSNPID